MLDVLHIEREAAAATAEAGVQEEAEEDCSDARSPTPPQSIERRTIEYVQKQARIRTDNSSFPNLEPVHENTESPSPTQHEVTQVNCSRYADIDSFLVIDEWPHEGEFAALPKRSVPQTAAHKHPESAHVKDPHLKDEPLLKIKAGNPAWPTPIHSRSSRCDHTQATHAQTPDMIVIAQYLACRELVNTGLPKCYDKP